MAEKTRCPCGNEAEAEEPLCKDCRDDWPHPFDDDEDSETRTRGERTDRFRYREVD